VNLSQLPNAITILRILLVVPLAWLIVEDRYVAALGVAAVAGASDALDGFIARRWGWRSRLGGLLDPIADKLLLTVAFIALALVDGLPGWLALLVIGRDFVIVGGAIAYHAIVGRFDAAPSRLSKWTTLVQIVCVLSVLVHVSGLSLRFSELFPQLLAELYLLTAALTVASGIHYIVVWGVRAWRNKHPA
jgi:cardiolipin synthase